MSKKVIEEWQWQYLQDHAAILTQSELSQQTGLCVSTIIRMLKQKKIKAYKQHFRQYKPVEIPSTEEYKTIFPCKQKSATKEALTTSAITSSAPSTSTPSSSSKPNSKRSGWGSSALV